MSGWHPEQRCCAEDFGGSHYHCAHCGQVAGMQGHYFDENREEGRVICPNATRTQIEGGVVLGFCCPAGHTCSEEHR